MKKILVGFLAALMVLTSVSPVCFKSLASDSEKNIFSETFESYNANTLPSATWTPIAASDDAMVTDEKASEGNKSFKTADLSTSSGKGFRTKKLPAAPGKLYTVEFDCVAESGACHMYIEFWKGDERLTPVATFLVQSSSWATYVGASVAPEEAETVTLLIYQDIENAGAAYFDNIKLTESDAANENGGDGYYDENAEAPPCIVEGYPRLFFTKDEKDDLIARKDDETKNYAGSDYKTIVQDIIAGADRYLGYNSFTISYYNGYQVVYKLPLEQPKPMNNPPGYNNPTQYPYWTGLATTIRESLKYLSTAYVLTGDERYAQKATSLCLDLAKWETWSDPTVGDGIALLDSGYITLGVCTAYDYLYDYFTDDQRETIKTAIYEKGLVKPLKAWGFKADDNTQVVITTGIAIAACTLHGEYEETSDAINKALAYFEWFLDRRVSLKSHEGNTYASLSLEYMMYALDAISRVTGKADLFDHEFITDCLFRWMIAGGESVKGNFAPISDSSLSPGFFITASILNKNTGNSYAGYFLKRSQTYNAGPDALLYGIIEPKYEEPGQELQSVYLDIVGWGSMRTGWGANDTTLVFTSSQSALGHNHLDNNSFVIAQNGTWIAIDPGYQDYSLGDNSDYTTKSGHSTIYVDGIGQSRRGNSTIAEKLNGGFFSYMIGSAEKAYMAPKLTKFDRSFIMVNHAENPYFIIKDDIDALEEHVYTWRLNISDAISVSVDGKASSLGTAQSGNSFESVFADSFLNVTFASENPLNINWYKYKSTAGRLVDVTDNVKSKDKNYLSVISVDGIGNVNINFASMVSSVVRSNDSSDISTANLDAKPFLLYKPIQSEECITLPVNVPKNGNYTINLEITTGKSYGDCEIYIGDTLVGTFSGYKDDYLDKSTVKFENVKLAAGEQEFKLVSKGSPIGQDKFYIGIISVKIENENPNSGKVIVSENIDNDSARGCVVEYGLSSVKNDIILFSKGEGINSNGVVTNGTFANVMGVIDGESTAGFAITDGKTLEFNGKLLMETSSTVNAAVTFESEEGSVISTRLKGTAKIYVPDDKLSNTITSVYVNGEPVEHTFDDDGYLTFKYPNGKSYINFDLEAKETSSGVGEEPENKGMIIVIFAALIVILVAVVSFSLLKKKRINKN